MSNTSFNICTITNSENGAVGSLSKKIGPDATITLAVIAEQIYDCLDELNTFGGGGLGAAATKGSQFLKALDQYDQAVAAFERLRNYRASPATLRRAQESINIAYMQLQGRFNKEFERVLKTYTSSSATRTINQGTRSARNVFNT